MIPGGLNTLTVIVLLLTVWHASHVLGIWHTLAFFVITAVTSWLFEELGVSTGLIYGPYHYTSTLGPLLGSVPFLIPLAWFVLVYPSYLVANRITDRLPARLPGDFLGLALCGALVMTASDLIVDPILSGPGFRAWVWNAAGRYYGVPAQNYVGWIATAFVIHLLCRSIERRAMPQLQIRSRCLTGSAYSRTPVRCGAMGRGPRGFRNREVGLLDPDRCRHVRPGPVGLALEPAEVDARDRQAQWSRKLETASIDAPASRRSLAAVCRRMWSPAGASPAAGGSAGTGCRTSSR